MPRVIDCIFRACVSSLLYLIVLVLRNDLLIESLVQLLFDRSSLQLSTKSGYRLSDHGYPLLKRSSLFSLSGLSVSSIVQCSLKLVTFNMHINIINVSLCSPLFFLVILSVRKEDSVHTISSNVYISKTVKSSIKIRYECGPRTDSFKLLTNAHSTSFIASSEK